MRRAPPALALALALALAAGASGAQAAALRVCDAPQPLSAAQQATLLRFADLVGSTLQASASQVALVARSGTDLRLFGQRYSHAGISLRDAPGDALPWAVRQLYYACDEDRPRLFDQGLAGFLLGADSPEQRYLSVLLLPAEAGAAVAQRAADNTLALQLLAARYSANAHAFSTRYQNCNQWVAELLALAWGGSAVQPALPGPAGASAEAPGAPSSSADPRAAAQAWLQAAGYVPTRFDAGSHLWLALASTLRWLHTDDHPADDLARAQVRVSMPSSIEAFVRARIPGVQRLEFCHHGQRMVMRQGWEPIADGCQPAAGDRVVVLD